MSKKKLFVLFIAITIVGFELFLRGYYGFCDTVLMRVDNSFEYIAEPNQKRFRFRNHIQYNSLSMRSPELVENSKHILGFGDSVLNGGVQTDQDSLASTKLSENLSELRGTNIQFLNISAGSWAPDNCYGYLQKFGNFNAEKIYLVVSSHDAFDNMDFKPIVGIHKSFPERQYKIAYYELLDRYLLPKMGLNQTSKDELSITKKTADIKFNTGFNSFYNYAKLNNIPLFIYLHADIMELKNKEYNIEGQKIIQFAKEHGITLIQDLNQGLNKNHFRDTIHLNDSGQNLMAQLILQNESLIYKLKAN